MKAYCILIENQEMKSEHSKDYEGVSKLHETYWVLDIFATQYSQ